MFEWSFPCVTSLAVEASQISQLNRMFVRSQPGVPFGRRRRIVDHRMADIAIVSNHLPALAHMLSVVTPEAAGKIEVTYVVRMGLPVGLHLRKRICLKDSL